MKYQSEIIMHIRHYLVNKRLVWYGDVWWICKWGITTHDMQMHGNQYDIGSWCLHYEHDE